MTDLCIKFKQLSTTSKAIRPATPADVRIILMIFQGVTDRMLEMGIHQWDGSYPNRENIEEDIRQACGYVEESVSGEVVGYICVNRIQDLQYENIHWILEEEPVFVIHRLGVSPKAWRNGVATRLCLWAEAVARDRGGRTIRLDAYSKNPMSCALYLKLGYHMPKGYCYFHDNEDPFVCFEKSLID